MNLWDICTVCERCIHYDWLNKQLNGQELGKQRGLWEQERQNLQEIWRGNRRYKVEER